MSRVLLPLFLSLVQSLVLPSIGVWQSVEAAPACRQAQANQGETFEQLRARATNLNEADAQYMLSVHYLLRQDRQESLKWLTKAAEQGHPRALLNLGNYYRDGTGVPKSYERAASYY